MFGFGGAAIFKGGFGGESGLCGGGFTMGDSFGQRLERAFRFVFGSSLCHDIVDCSLLLGFNWRYCCVTREPANFEDLRLVLVPNKLTEQMKIE